MKKVNPTKSKTNPTKPNSNFGFKQYYKPTPIFWRKVGDSMLAGATLFAVGGLWDFNTLGGVLSAKAVSIITHASIFLGIVGKLLSNFFSDSDTQQD